MCERRVIQQLLRYGRSLEASGSYTGDPHSRAEQFVRNNPNAWLMGVIFDQSQGYERAWKAPYYLSKRLDHFSMERLAKMSVADIRRAIRGSGSPDDGAGVLVRYWRNMASWIKKAAVKLVKEYDGNATNIWQDCLTAGEVIERLDDFPGIGQKKAHMAARILHEDEQWGFSRWDQINVAVDVHVRRVWRRAGLTKDTSTEAIMAAATRLWPKYPGALDYPTWMIGMAWCQERGADCQGKRKDAEGQPCPLTRVCPKIGVGRGHRRPNRSR